MDFNTTSLRDAVQKACPGENILWVGRPNAGLRFTAMDFFLVPFSLFWGGAMLFAMIPGLVRSGFPTALIAVPLSLGILYVFAGRFIVSMMRRSRTIYGLTDRSAVIVASMFGSRSSVISLAAIPEIVLQHRGREGSVVFGIPAGAFDRNDLRVWGAAPPVPSFEYITDAERVYQMALDIRAASLSARQVAT